MNFKIEGSGETLVFIHGLSDNLMYWEFLAANLIRNYQVLRIDLRGHGDSELGDGEISIDAYVDDLYRLLMKLNISKVNLIGFSLGGAVALDFTVNHSQKVDSLILMSSFYNADNHLKNIFNQFKKALNDGFDEFYDFMLPKVLCQEVIDKHKVELEMLKQINSNSANVEAYIKAVDACMNFDVENELSEIDVPTLILAGEYDEIFPLTIQKELQNKIKNSKLIIFENTKHNLLVGKNNKKILSILKNISK